MKHRTIVLKFGSSVLRSAADLPAAVHEIYRWYREGWRVVAVVSALDATTDRLLYEARTLTPNPEPQALAELLATGERRSAALLGIALDRAGIPARVADPREAGFTTAGTALDATPVELDRKTFERWFEQDAVIVFPGFFGYDITGRLQLLGRGGSDLSAVYLAEALEAQQCCLLKDVDGVYERDPASATNEPARRFATLGYEDAIERAQKLIQPKAVRALQRLNRTASVAALGRDYQSVVGPFECQLVDRHPSRPLRVLVLGLGTVGFSVYQRLLAMPDRFHPIGILVRDRAKHLARGIPEALLIDRQQDLPGLEADVVIDALPGIEPSTALSRYFLAHGVHVVTANKAAMAENGAHLEKLAQQTGATLRYSAAVGGGVPMIETVQRLRSLADVACFEAILNGTSNFVLSRCARGVSFEDAVREAQAAGFAELDPSEDLSGRDAARKLLILSRLAFGKEPDEIQIEAINAASIADKRAHLPPDHTLRHIARVSHEGSTVNARLELAAVHNASPLGRTVDEFNYLAITTIAGDMTSVRGRGAGGWPTAEAIMGDLRGLSPRQQART